MSRANEEITTNKWRTKEMSRANEEIATNS